MMVDLCSIQVSLHREPPEVELEREVCIGGWSSACQPHIESFTKATNSCRVTDGSSGIHDWYYPDNSRVENSDT